MMQTMRGHMTCEINYFMLIFSGSLVGVNCWETGPMRPKFCQILVFAICGTFTPTYIVVEAIANIVYIAIWWHVILIIFYCNDCIYVTGTENKETQIYNIAMSTSNKNILIRKFLHFLFVSTFFIAVTLLPQP